MATVFTQSQVILQKKPAWLIEAEQLERRASKALEEALDRKASTAEQLQDLAVAAEFAREWLDDCRHSWRCGMTPESLKDRR